MTRNKNITIEGNTLFLTDRKCWNCKAAPATTSPNATTVNAQYRSSLYPWYLAVGKQNQALGDERSLFNIILDITDSDLHHGIITEEQEFNLFMDALTAEMNGEYA